MVLVQKWPFFNLFFCVNTGKENVFYDILAQKNAFLGYKNKKKNAKKKKKETEGCFVAFKVSHIS